MLPTKHSVNYPNIREALLNMKEQDQLARARFMRDQSRENETIMETLDSEHTEKLKAIIAQYGQVDSHDIGQDGLNAFSLILLHSPNIKFKEKMLPFIETRYANGELEGQDYALLIDKILVNKGEKQYYGTQFILKHGQYVPEEIIDASKVDARRQAVGLPSLAEYSRLINEYYTNLTQPPE